MRRSAIERACGGGSSTPPEDPRAHLYGLYLNLMMAVNASYSVALGDVDGDGDLDLVEGNYNGQSNRVYLNDGTGNNSDSGQALGIDDTTAIALGDVDGDYDLDLVAGNFGNQANRVYLNLSY